MLLTLKIAVFYGAPILALVLAIAYFAVLLQRLRRGVLTASQAGLRYSLTLLLPALTLLVIWGTAEITGYFALPPGRRAWHADAAAESFLGLLPIALYVAIPVAMLVFVFWGILLFSRKR